MQNTAAHQLDGPPGCRGVEERISWLSDQTVSGGQTMKTREIALAAVILSLATSIAIGEQSQADLASRLVGTWRLNSRVTVQQGKEIPDPNLGETPVAYLTYDFSGHVAVQLMRRNRSTDVECAQSGPVPSNNTQKLNGYDAYFGTYTVDEKNGTVTHHVEGSLVAGDIGKNLVRHFQLSGDVLILRVSSTLPEQLESVLHWERVTGERH